jgi:sRNA-binding carbon storage regulator CsrA
MEEIMGLKLMVEKGDKILMGDDTIITVMSLGKRPQIHIDAPPDVKLLHIKSDPDKQFLNRKKGA